jgi:carbohydrate-selective porin OprB
VVAAGTGIYFRQKADVLGLGLNWGRPSAKTYGSQLRDQYTIEIYYRAQVFRHLAVTPDLQVLVRPADNPEVSAIAVIGARARLIF